jgi:hypothetical protein
MVSPDSLAQRARCQAETPLIALFRFPIPTLGAFVGFAATAIIGFTWGGWTLGKTARDMADKSAATAAVAALAPICVDKFQHDVDARTNLTELMKISSWHQGSFVQKGGWATLPGTESGNSVLAQTCANLLTSLK